jgi:hypothetical protein
MDGQCCEKSVSEGERLTKRQHHLPQWNATCEVIRKTVRGFIKALKPSILTSDPSTDLTAGRYVHLCN